MAVSQREAVSHNDRFFASQINYHYSESRHQRIIGPPKDTVATNSYSELFISRLPKNINTQTLFTVFAMYGKIYKLRIMQKFYSTLCNGLLYVSYYSEDSAARAIQHLNGCEIMPNCFIKVEKSFDNKRLYIGGIPPCKLRDEIWKELKAQGMKGIVDVITYRAYGNPSHTRGFAFIEFESHSLAAWTLFTFRNMSLFGVPVIVEWSVPLAEVPEKCMQNSCKLFLRNLQIQWTAVQIERLVNGLLYPRRVLKVYRSKDYAFVHFMTRADAEYALSLLRIQFTGSPVEIEWGRPQSRVTNPAFRKKQILKLMAKRRNNAELQRSSLVNSSGSSTHFSVNGVNGINAGMSSLTLNEAYMHHR